MFRASLQAAVFLLLALPLVSGAAEFRVGDVFIENPWSRPPPPVAVTGAAYFALSIRGNGNDKLIKVDSPIAERVEMHQHSMQNGVMSMRRVPDVEIVSQRPTVFEPGGLHIMLIGLREHLPPGATFPLTLTFEKAGSVTVIVDVQESAEPGGGHG